MFFPNQKKAAYEITVNNMSVGNLTCYENSQKSKNFFSLVHFFLHVINKKFAAQIQFQDEIISLWEKARNGYVALNFEILKVKQDY